jgi:hypothetical protein
MVGEGFAKPPARSGRAETVDLTFPIFCRNFGHAGRKPDGEP